MLNNFLVNKTLVLFMLIGITFGAYNDFELETYYQPDQTQFVAKHWGDEYFNYWETDDGYRILHWYDGYWYYAELDENGEFTKSKFKVGIDTPPQSSLGLLRHQSRIDSLEVDQIVHIRGDVEEGEFCRVKIEDANEFELKGIIIN